MWKQPNKEDLQKIVAQASNSLLLCSPYISHSGLETVHANLQTSLRKLAIWTKLDLHDYLVGASEPDALLDFLDDLPDSITTELRAGHNLHAKVVVANAEIALAGSPNLTYGGFAYNIEIARIVAQPESREINDYLLAIEPRLEIWNTHRLRGFVTECLKHTSDREALIDIIRELVPSERLGPYPLSPISSFIDFCRRTPGLASDEVIKIYTNADLNNRTGHLKQTYYAVQRFLQQHAGHVQRVSEAPLVEAYELQQAKAILNDWLSFVASHADDEDPLLGYRLQTLLGYLTSQFGGRRKGGGGGDYPFKLVWPLVARMMQQT